VLKLHGLLCASDETRAVILILNRITRCDDSLPTLTENEKQGSHIVSLSGGEERLGRFICCGK
jgi:hypothetical protein